MVSYLNHPFLICPDCVFLQRCHSWRHCDRRRVPTTQQDCEVQRPQSDKGRWSQEAVPEVLDVTLSRKADVG